MASHTVHRGGLMFMFVMWASCSLTLGLRDTLYYELEDNTLEESFIGNLVNDAKLGLDFTPDQLRDMSYQILSLDAPYDQYFTVGENTGNIKTLQLVDRDVLCPGEVDCELRMSVGLYPSTPFQVIFVFIKLHDTNDNAPRFNQDQVTYELTESALPGIISPIIPAQDLDSPRNGISGYRLVDESKKFSINVYNNTEYNLEITLMLLTMLDRELTEEFKLQVIAYDGGEPSRTGTLDLNVKVLDINDNQPEFDQKTYNLTISENHPVNKSLVRIHATDPDAGDNGNVLYGLSLSTMRDVGDTFAVNSESGELTLKQGLDYETRKSYTLTIVAQDSGINAIPTNCKVFIAVLDENDITPLISVNSLPDSGRLQVDENLDQGAFVAHLSIIDQEMGLNGQAECYLGDNEYFTMEMLYEKEYKVVTVQKLDREDTPELTINVICSDKGTPPRSDEQEFAVDIVDENDNDPVFTAFSYHGQVEENRALGNIVTRVTASDIDAGLNGDVRYSFVEFENPYFEINTVNGIITTKAVFDREEREEYGLTIMASDMGDQPRSTLTTLVITVIDQDDNQPAFNQNSYELNVTENTALGTLVGSVHATDLDGPSFNKFQYYLVGSDLVKRTFYVNRDTGAVHTNFTIDREAKDQYKFNVVVRSAYSETDRDQALVIVNVLDVNDNPPIISYPSHVSNHIVISNEAPVGYKVTKVISYDIDLSNNSIVGYQMTQQEDGEVFYIDEDTGNIYVNQELHSITEQNFTLQILVSDYGIPRRTSVATLYVTVNNSVVHVRQSISNNGGKSVSLDLLAVVIGCICGAIIVILLVVLVILLLLRRRKNKRREMVKTWVVSERSTSPLSTSSSQGGDGSDTNTIVNKHFTGDEIPIVNSNNSTTPGSVVEVSTGSSRKERRQAEMGIIITDQPSDQRSDSPQSHVPGEKDSDSGCFDLSHSDSQSSTESNQDTGCRGPSSLSGSPSSTQASIQASSTPAGAPTVIQTKCYHPHTLHPPQNTYPMTTFSPQQPPYPAPELNGGPPDKTSQDSSQTLDFTQPQNPTAGGGGKPKPPPRFTDWLQSESQQLKQRGHVYRVSNPRLKPSNSVKKTVRFSEPNDKDGSEDHRSSPRAVPNDYVDHSSLVLKQPQGGTVQGGTTHGDYCTGQGGDDNTHNMVNIPKESYHGNGSSTRQRLVLTDGTSGSNLQLNSLV